MPATIAIALFRGDHTPTRSRLHKLSATRRAAEPGAKVRERSPTFSDHFSQATQFWNSMSDWEKDHIAAAFAFELNQVVDDGVRNRTMNEILVNIDEELAKMVSEAPGVAVAPAGAPEASTPSVPTPSGPLRKDAAKLSSPALSMDKAPPPLSLVGRKVAVLVGNGADARDVQAALVALGEEGFFCWKRSGLAPEPCQRRASP
jgi:catalase